MNHMETRDETNGVGEGLDTIVGNVETLQGDKITNRIRNVRDIIATNVQRQQCGKSE